MGANSRGGISLETLLKESLIASARSVSLKKDPSMEIHESGVGFDWPDISLHDVTPPLLWVGILHMADDVAVETTTCIFAQFDAFVVVQIVQMRAPLPKHAAFS